MIEFTDKNTDFLIAFRLKRTLTIIDVIELATVLNERCGKGRPVNLFIEVDDSVKCSLEKFIERIKISFGTFAPNVIRFQKAAIVTDKDRLRKIAVLKDKFFAAEIKGFTSNEQLKALDWAISFAGEVYIKAEPISQYA